MRPPPFIPGAAAEKGRGKGGLCRPRWHGKYGDRRGGSELPPHPLQTLTYSLSSSIGSGFDLGIALHAYYTVLLAVKARENPFLHYLK